MKWFKLFGILLIGILATWTVMAVPTGPSDINYITSSRYSVNAASNVSAIAGNTTELNFVTNSITNTWQGYYGNISGNILLGDSNNNTLYNWSTASPNGEIYATTGSLPNWTSIRCANQTEIDDEDAALGVNQTTDQDSVNRTFQNTTTLDVFYVGTQVINSSAQNCYAVNLNDETGSSSTDFQEVILHDNASSLVYTALIKQNSNGFDGNTHDFEMLVGEDGHNGDNNPTTYYFYVELG